MKRALLMVAMVALVVPGWRPRIRLWTRLSAENFAQLALACVHQEYPNKIGHVMNSDDDVDPPRKLTPSFYGCFDWHSSVHGHWLLIRLSKLYPDAEFVPSARAALAESFTEAKIAAEVSLFRWATARTSTERPYGLAWLLCLAEELATWDDEQAEEWSATLDPLDGAGRRAIPRLAAQALLPDPHR